MVETGRRRRTVAGVLAALVMTGTVVVVGATSAAGLPTSPQTLLVGEGGQVEAAEGVSYPLASPDGRYVVFRSRDSILPVVDDLAAQQPGDDFDLPFFCAEPPDVPEADCFGPDVFLLDTKATDDPADDTVELVTVASDGTGGGFDAVATDLTPDGDVVVLHSGGDDLVPGDTIAGNDVFLRDRASGTTTRVSVKSDGSQATYLPPGTNNDSRDASVDDSGTVVAFRSTNRSLAPETPVPGDTWQQYDIYVRDISAADPADHTTERLTVGTGGEKADGSSGPPVVSPDGRFVSFTSAASNLVPGDTNGATDVFVHDRDTGTTTRLDITDGVAEPTTADTSLAAVTPDGRWLLLTSASALAPADTNGIADVYRVDTVTGDVTVVSDPAGAAQADGSSVASTITDDGRYVVFGSSATTLVPGDSNARADVFRADVETGTIVRVSLTPDGDQRTTASGTGVGVLAGTQVLYTGAPGLGLWLAQVTPDQVQDVDVQRGEVEIFVSWSPPANAGVAPLDTYTVTATPVGDLLPGAQTLSATVAASETFAEFVAVQGQQYEVTVVATTAAGASPPSPPQLVRPASGPDAPELTATPGDASVVLEWTVPATNGEAVTEYEVLVFLGPIPNANPQQVTTVTVPADQTSLIVTDLTNGQVYGFLVQARARELVGASSAPVNVTPVAGAGGPVHVLPEPGLEALMAALAAEIDELEVVDRDPVTGTYAFPGCTAAALPAESEDYLALLAGGQYAPLVGAGPVGPVTADCAPDAVTVFDRAPG